MLCLVPLPQNMTVQMTTHHLALPNPPPPPPFTSSVDQILQTSQTDQLLHHLYTRPTVETTVLDTVKQNARGGGIQMRWGCATLLSPRKRGGKNNSKNKTHLSGQQDLHKCVCFRDCNGSLMRHEYSATYQNEKHLMSECTRQPTVHQLAMLVRH